MVVYGLFVGEDCYYIGQSNNVDKRFIQHKKDIQNKKHSVKALHKVDIDMIDMRVICKLNTDNSLLIMLIEALYNVLYHPKNKIVWCSGRNTVMFARCREDIAWDILRVLKDYKIIY